VKACGGEALTQLCNIFDAEFNFSFDSHLESEYTRAAEKNPQAERRG
jgi:hypothetical protein